MKFLAQTQVGQKMRGLNLHGLFFKGNYKSAKICLSHFAHTKMAKYAIYMVPTQKEIQYAIYMMLITKGPKFAILMEPFQRGTR